MEQPPVDAGLRVRHSAGEGHSRGLHSGCRGTDAQGSQSSVVCVQSLFRGWYYANSLSRSIGIVYNLVAGSTVLL